MKTPVGWSIKSLDELIELDVETLSTTTPRDFSFYYLDISAASQGRLSIPAVTTDFFEAPSRARKVVRRGDVLMSMVRPHLKAFALFDQTLQPCVASTGFAVLRSKSETSAAFILYSILSEDVSSQIDGLVTSSNYPAINSTAVRALKILTPPKDEQSNIAEVLSTVDQAIEQTEALIAKQKRIKTGLMQDLLTRGIDEHG
jgi:type I restriction enzyme S subunit